MPRPQSALVVGAGSIGRRHLSNLRLLGVPKLAAFDIHPERVDYAVAECRAEPFASLAGALANFRPDVVLVCTPPVHHIEQALQAVRGGAHVFIEKPLSDRMEGVEELAKESSDRGRMVQIGYNLRFHAPLQKLKQLMEEKVVGRILWGHIEAGNYLPNWRTWQDYRKSYTARRELGGGIILDGSHELDYALWLFGTPVELACMAGRVSQLEVDVEDCATILLRFPDGAQVDVHVDFIQRTYSRSCVLAGENGKLTWEFISNTVQTVHADGRTESVKVDCEPNDMYVVELRHFLDCIERGKQPQCGLDEGIVSLKVALAARLGAAERKWVDFG